MKAQWKLVLFSVLTGLVIGIASVTCFFHCRMHRTWDNKAPYKHMENRFSSALNLTDEQKTQVNFILEEQRNKINTLRTEMKPKFEEIRKYTQNKIRNLLTPEQQKKFDVFEAKMSKRMKKFCPEGPRGPKCFGDFRCSGGLEGPEGPKGPGDIKGPRAPEGLKDIQN